MRESRVTRIRDTLAGANLQMLFEINVCDTVKEIGVGIMAPPRARSAGCPFSSLGPARLDGIAALIIRGHAMRTLVHILNPGTIRAAGIPAGITDPLTPLQVKVSRALKRLSVRRGAAEFQNINGADA